MPKIENQASGSVVRICQCDHEYQDKRYGKKRRLHNICLSNTYRCTVCGAEKH